MRKYIINRIIRSIISLIAVVAIVFVLIYSLIPKENIFNNDTAITKYQGDNKINYIYTNYERYGYLDYVTLSEYCVATYPDIESTEYFQCNKGVETNVEISRFIEHYESLGYTTEMRSDGKPFAYKDINPIKMMLIWFKNLFIVDNPNSIQSDLIDEDQRGIYFGKDWSGNVAIMCNGCTNKYQLYFDGSFPFIHQNWIKLNLGTSFPTYSGKSIVSVIGTSQGAEVMKTVTFPTGVVAESAIQEHSCQFKDYLNALEKQRFTDYYADCTTYKSDWSMIGTSFLIGIFSIIIAYFVGIPIGMLMARNKNKAIDKIGMAYIIFIISVPSLAYIFMFSRLGAAIGLPIKFPMLGAHNVYSYILPIVSLALPSISGLMMWVRRYMIDQSLSDYVKFARSKGLSENEIFYKHIMRNAIIPIAHSIPLNIVGTLVGAIITERVYAVPGMGKMLTDSINNYNNAMIVALTFIYTALSILGLLLGDILISMIDPRISFEGEGGRK